jgi:DNA-directed RNA polymerase subunit A"
MSIKTENKLDSITVWKLDLSFNYLKQKSNLAALCQKLNSEFKEKPIVYMNLDQFRTRPPVPVPVPVPVTHIHGRSKRRRKLEATATAKAEAEAESEAYENKIFYLTDAIKHLNENFQKMIIWRAEEFIESDRWRELIDYMIQQIERRKVHSGEMVGVIAAQSISERFVQSTLSSFHIVGSRKLSTQMGIKRIVELLDALKKIKMPILKNIRTECDGDLLVERTMESISVASGIRYKFTGAEKPGFSKYEIFFRLQKGASKYVRNTFKKIFGVAEIKLKTFKGEVSDEPIVDVVFFFYEKITIEFIKTKLIHISKIIVSGVHGADIFEDNNLFFKEGTENYKTLDFTDIVNVCPDVDLTKIIPNDIHFIFKTLGIEATRQYLVNELKSVLGKEGIEVDIRHIMLLIDNMTYRGGINPNKYGGIDLKDSVILKASFEQATNTFIKASSNYQIERLDNVSSQILMGKLADIGTNIIDITSDVKLWDVADVTETETVVEKEVAKAARDVEEIQPEYLQSETLSPAYVPMDEDEGAPDAPDWHGVGPLYCPASPVYCPASPEDGADECAKVIVGARDDAPEGAKAPEGAPDESIILEPEFVWDG